MKLRFIFACGVVIAILLIGCTMKKRADLIITNGNIYTVDASFSKCSAVAVKKGIIVATGSDEEILERYKSRNIIDLKGAALYPGFNDAHAHIYNMGQSLKRVDLRGAPSYNEILERLKERFKSENPTYLAGDGWDQNLWEVKEFPNNSELNELFPDIPVVLSRIDFHAVIANDKAIEMLGITPEDPSIPSGEAEIKDGKFTGVFMETMCDRLSSVLPENDRSLTKSIMLAAQQECFKYGLTSLATCGEPLSIIEALDSMYTDGSLKIRLDAWLTPNDDNLERFQAPYTNGGLRIGTIKLYVDGALGSRGALLVEPYSDVPGIKGLKVISDEEFYGKGKWAYEHGFQVATHCIGDAANREALKMYSSFLSEDNDKRWRIEHAQIVQDSDIDTFGKYNIVPSIQPTHATSDMLWADERLGERLKKAYRYKDLLAQTGWVPSGTDFPIESVNPVYTFFAAVYRKNLDFVPDGGFQMENAFTKEEALRSITIWAAKSSFEEDKKGSIERGKYADFVVLDRDIMNIDEREVPGAKVLMTFLGGEQVL
jgi:Predicted metal-dependent hydrolase with the TIM-barrel fold